MNQEQLGEPSMSMPKRDMAEQNTRTQAAEESFSKALKKLEALKFLDWTATNGIRCNVLPGIEEAGYEPLDAVRWACWRPRARRPRRSRN